MWTMENTDGFTQAELEIINRAHEIIARKIPDIDASNINDLLNNAWAGQATADELAAAVCK